MASPTPPEPAPAERLLRARSILAAEGRPLPAGRPGTPAPTPSHAKAGCEPEQPPATAAPGAPSSEPACATAEGRLALLQLHRASAANAAAPGRAGLRRWLLSPAAPGQATRLELATLSAALIGAAFIGSLLPSDDAVRAATVPAAPVAIAAAPAAAGAAATVGAASGAGSAASSAVQSTASTSALAAAGPPAAAPATAPATADPGGGTADDGSGDAADGSDPLAGGADTLARVALVVTHGDDPATWPSAAAGSAPRARAALGTTFTGLGLLPGAPLATGLALVAGQPANAATRAGCTTSTPVTPGTVDEAGVATGAGCDYPDAVPSIPGAIARDGRTWRAYTPAASPEDAAAHLCHPYDAPDPATTAAAQMSPLGHLGDLVSSGACDAAARPLTALADDLAADDPPAWIFIDLGDCTAGACDSALDAALATLADAAPPDDGRAATLVVGDGTLAGAAPTEPGTYPPAALDEGAPAAVQAGMLLLGTGVSADATDPLMLDPLVVARTQAAWLGVTAPGLAASDGTSPLAVPSG